MARSLRAALLTVVVAVGCLSPTEPQTCGMFAGRAGGATTDSLSGCAIFTINLDNSAFGILITNGGIPNFDPSIKLIRDLGRPEPGTYPIAPFQCGQPGSLCGLAFFAQREYQLSGTFVVTGSDTLSVIGSLDAIGTDSDGATLTIRGSFRAECKGQKKPFEVRGDPIANTEKATPCKPSTGAG